MAGNRVRTSKQVASKAAKLLRGKSSRTVKSVAGSAVSNRRK